MSETAVRRPCALGFYERDCSPDQIERYLRGFELPDEPVRVCAGVVPHAGWRYSGAIAARVVKSIQQRAEPNTLVLLGTAHRGGRGNALWSGRPWWTPLGQVEVDEELGTAILQAAGSRLVADDAPHLSEHSLEVVVPFIKHLLPTSRIVSILVAPEVGAVSFGETIGRLLREREGNAVVVGTTDLTHYGAGYGLAPAGYGAQALRWMRENDQRMIDMATAMRAEEILGEAAHNHNACGAGALSATVSAARAQGASKGYLLEYATSFDVEPAGEFEMGVGYAGIVF
jgi:AmmeMemoRadiSam system protein B